MVLEGERGVHLNALGEVHTGGEEQQGLPLDRGVTVEAPGNARAEVSLKTYKSIEIRYKIFKTGKWDAPSYSTSAFNVTHLTYVTRSGFTLKWKT